MAFFLQNCATTTPQTDKLIKKPLGLPMSSKIKNVPFIKQSQNHCGPASLAMILESLNKKSDLKQLSIQTITPKANGTYTTDLTTSVRRQGMLGIEVKNLENLLTEIAAGHPVLVFQNLGFSFLPKWHYAVALGYDLEGPDMILHSGSNKYLKNDMRFFERTWNLAENWGLVILPPGQISATGTELAHAASASGLERIGKLGNAQLAYESILNRWPKSLPALIGLANITHAQRQYHKSIRYLNQAVKFHPISSTAWHNLAVVQGKAGKKRDAEISAKTALKLASPSEKIVYLENLKDYLN